MVSSVLALTSPLMTWRTAPCSFLIAQVLQTPMRQPYSGVRPAVSACSRIVLPEFSATVPERSKLRVPDAWAAAASSRAGSIVGTLKYSMRSWSAASCSV